MKVTYYVASSLDGYIAKSDGDVAWLDELAAQLQDSGYAEFYSTVDALVMGRNTYNMIYNFGEWPYGDKPTWVCSNREIKLIEGCNLQAGVDPEEVIQQAKKMNIKHLWLVGGGRLASSFLLQNLLTKISVSLMPIILGNGIKLFDTLPTHIRLQKEEIKQLGAGCLQIEYSINQK